MSETSKMDRNLALEAVRVTEAAALSASRLMGRGDEKAADQAAVDAMREEGATALSAMRGPCIRACCYEFSDDDLDAVAGLFGPGVRAQSRRDLAALDLPAAVSAALAAEGIREEPGIEVCTACGEGYFSHRARRDAGRQALLVWREPETG